MAQQPFVASETLSAERAEELNKAEKRLEVMTNMIEELEEIGEEAGELKQLVKQTRAVIAIMHRTQERLV